MIDHALLERRQALLTQHFFNRTDIVAALVPRGREQKCYPLPVKPTDLKAALRAHLAGPEAPSARYEYKSKRSMGMLSGRYRLGSYVPGQEGATPWICLDFDGPGHTHGLKDPLAGALRTQAALRTREIDSYLECSGGGQGWHLWLFFEPAQRAKYARMLAHALIPRDLECLDGTWADPRKQRGIEVFPKTSMLGEQKVLGNMVWLPWWAGAVAPANLFHREDADGSVAPQEPESFRRVPPAHVLKTLRELKADGLLVSEKETSERKRRNLAAYSPAHVVVRDDEYDKLESALAHLDPDCGYPDWLRIGMALHEWDPLQGFALWDQWSRKGNKYKAGETNSKWYSFERDPNGITIGTLFQMAQQRGWKTPVPPLDTAPTPSAQSEPTSTESQPAAETTGFATGAPNPGAPPTSPESAPRTSEPPTPATTAGAWTLSDSGNAHRLAARHGRDLRYCDDLGGWLVWDGSRWVRDKTFAVFRYARDIVYNQYARELNLTKDADAQEAIKSWVKHSESSARINAMVELARSEPGIPAAARDFDTIEGTQWLLNVKNGTIDLRTGALKPHARADLITQLANVRYEPDARCPRWLAFLDRIFDQDNSIIDHLQRVLGYCLTGNVAEQCLFIGWGVGNNGKGVLTLVVSHILGDYACALQHNLLVERQFEEHPTALADLRGRRYAVLSETGMNATFDEALVKRLTGGDTVRARFMRQDYFEFRPSHKFFLCVNHRPNIKGQDQGIWRRMRLIPFRVQIPESEIVRDLHEQLLTEAPGILNWLVQGCLAWQRDGLKTPAALKEMTSDWRKDHDVFGNWLQERCVFDAAFKAGPAELRSDYNFWRMERGAKVEVSERTFAEMMLERGFERSRTGSNRYWRGLQLVPEIRPTSGSKPS